MRKMLAVAACLAMLLPATAALAENSGQRQQAQEAAALDLYEVEVGAGDDVRLREEGYDVVEVEAGSKRRGKATLHVEMVLSRNEARKLRRDGVDVEVVTNENGLSTAQAATLEAQDGFEVWRSYGEPGGIADEIRLLAEQYPDLLKLVTIGQTVQGQDILALKLTADANRVKDGKRPAVLYSSAQHAREWITVETNRRLLRHYLESYGSDARITDIVDTRELWFVLVANPDGYDISFTDGNRLWRKNARDNNGDGEFSLPGDGVDLNRNWPYKWGYDNEGSSPEPSSQVYRGPSPGSEPETQALDGLLARIGFAFHVNYHSAAELLLYGIGWQVATPSPDDQINVALNGVDENPAVPGYDPDISAELYTTNGETTNHAHAVYGTLAYTPELDTCESAEAMFDDDEFGDTYCEDEGRSVFEFPDDEELVQAVFQKNLEYALAVAESADDPANPESPVGIEAPDFVVDDFAVSYGSPQTVAVDTKREFRNLTMYYTINDGRRQKVKPDEWDGGERYGEDFDVHYAEYRGEVTGAEPGDEVTVWFEAKQVSKGRGNDVKPEKLRSEEFTYTLASDSGAPVLIVANEDYEGFNPEQDVDEPQYVDEYAAALEANGIAYDVWDVTAQGVPHDLGVLGHYDAVVWELGDNRLTQEADDVLTETPFGPLPDLSVAETQQFLTLSMRDYLNQGGKVFESGEYVAFFGFFASALGGAYYALDGAPEEDCVVTQSFFSDCLIYSDDFAQYYQGVFNRQSFGEPDQVQGIDTPLTDLLVDVNGAETPDSGAFTVTSDILPPDEFPQFTSWTSALYASDEPFAFEPFSGEHYVAATHADGAWMRLSRTVDLTGATSGSLEAKLSYNTEGGFDHVIVEARPVGTDDWTTLPDQATADGGTSTTVPAQCEAAFFIQMHPDLANYLTLGNPCQATGATGEWNSFTGDSGGWTDVEVDLSAYAGQQVEVSISYVTDPATGGLGVFVDDTSVTVDGTVVDSNDFESGLGAWSVPGAPASSPGNASDWQRTTTLFDPPAASVTTEDTVTFGFGFEAIAAAEERATVMGRIMDYLLGTP
ncbi:M14 family metallopeptidase [soil metagenome]